MGRSGLVAEDGMTWLGRWFRVLVPAAGLVLAGCGSTTKPYANDPLVTSGRAVRGDQEKARSLLKVAEPEPAAPSAPHRRDAGIVAAREQSPFISP